jgi:methyl-accepting chemotaxis protein
MNQTYSREEVIRTGKEMIEFLLEVSNSANNISGFLKEYIGRLTSEDGIYSRQEEALERYAESRKQTQAEADSMIQTSRINAQALQTICGEFQNMNIRITEAQKGREMLDKKVQDLNRRIKEINSFIRNIQEVSEQTNLLSFNASIEAARAGVAGKGFRIIANEVKSLSEQTKTLSSDIDTKVKDLQKDVESVVAENKSNDSFMDALMKTAQDSNEKLVKIQSDTQENTRFMEQVLSQMAENQNAILSATKETERENLRQVQEIASQAAQNSIHTGDQLSFLFQLRKLFAWLETDTAS